MRYLSLCVFSLLFVACGSSPKIDQETFDYPAWQADKNGCNGDRVVLWESLKAIKPQLISLTEMEVVEVLGKPDRRSLFSRNQKAALYYLDPAPECQGAEATGERRVVRVLFNALNQAKEITVVIE